MKADDYAPAPSGGRTTGKVGLVIAALFIMTVLFLRLKQIPRVQPAQLSEVYTLICQHIRFDDDLDDAYDQTRDLIRTPGASAESHFLYQLVRALNDEPQTSEALARVEADLPRLISAGEFDSARDRVADLVVTTDVMSEARGRLWGEALTSIEIRWDRDCDVSGGDAAPVQD